MLEAGAYVHIDLAPVRGREQGGSRPALVLSTDGFHSISEMAIICPITSNLGPWPYKVVLPEGEPITGAVLVDQIRSLHRGSRGFREIGKASGLVLDEVKSILAALLLIEGG